LGSAVARMREFAARRPPERHPDELVEDYDDLPSVWAATFTLVDSTPFGLRTEAETRDLLYMMARDNEGGHLVARISDEHCGLVAPLSRALDWLDGHGQ
jgi:hypothetical protein